MITIELIQAEQGDCIWIEYGEDTNRLHRMLIDGGTSGTYKHLKSRIKNLSSNARHFDLLVVTHIDADHIAGILKLIEDEALGISFEDIWFNGYRHLGKMSMRGISQAEWLSNYLMKPHVRWNSAFNGKAACVDTKGRFPALKLPGGMRLTLLSPTKKSLAELKPKWKKEALKAGLVPKEDAAYQEDMDTIPFGVTPFTQEGSVNIEHLATTPCTPDTSLTNGSSIAFIAEYEGKKMLFSGDAHADILLQSLKKKLPGCKPLYLDLFKVPHHGSDGNMTQKLLERIRCSRYLISTNGAYFKHPDRVAIAKIIKYGGHKPDLYFNYLSTYNAVWHTPSLQKQYNYQAHYPSTNQTAITLHL